MKHIRLIIIALFTFSLAANAQEVKKMEASAKDYIELLKVKGYDAYPVDISCLNDSSYMLEFEIKEYIGGEDKEVSSRYIGRSPNRRMVKDFMWRKLSDEEMKGIKKEACDFENGVFSRAEKITVGFMPSEVDSLRQGRIIVENMTAFNLKIEQKPITNTKDNETMYAYNIRPFKPSKFEVGKFIPLVFYCSFWYDSDYNIFRCCGEREIDPDMTSEILKRTPHYYVIGFTATKQ